MLEYIAPNLTCDLNGVPYPLMRVGVQGYFDRLGRDGVAQKVNYILWADSMTDAPGGYVLCLHMAPANKAADHQMAVHVIGAGGDKRYPTLEAAIDRLTVVAKDIQFKEVNWAYLVNLLRDRILMFVVAPQADEIEIDIPPDTNYH